MASAANVKKYFPNAVPLTLEQADQNFQELINLINEYNSFVSNNPYAKVTISSTAPVDPNVEDFWWDTTTNNLKIYYDDGTSASWVSASSVAEATTAADVTYDPATSSFASTDVQAVIDEIDAYLNDIDTAIDTLVTISTTEPASPGNEEFWFDKTAGYLKLYDASVPGWVRADGGVAALPTTSLSSVDDEETLLTAKGMFDHTTSDDHDGRYYPKEEADRLKPIVINTNTLAVSANTYVIAANLILTLPANPTVGDNVSFSNRSGVKTITISRNGENIMGINEDMLLDDEHARGTLMYTNSTRGWVLV